ncbi:hypothetical protein BZ160_03820 [Pantoea vagans]|nr:hypothetical protein BZ160_03820 [Pantoea vagans]
MLYRLCTGPEKTTFAFALVVMDPLQIAQIATAIIDFFINMNSLKLIYVQICKSQTDICLLARQPFDQNP